jgi:hypothetical protein
MGKPATSNAELAVPNSKQSFEDPKIIQAPSRKRRSAYNALKNGIFSCVVHETGDERAQYQRLLEGFREYFAPVGAPEEVLVEKLAMLEWRHRRLVLAERGEILDMSESVEYLSLKQEFLEAHEHRMSTSETEGLLGGCLNPTVLKNVMSELGQLLHFIEAAGIDCEMASHILRGVYGWDENRYVDGGPPPGFYSEYKFVQDRYSEQPDEKKSRIWERRAESLLKEEIKRLEDLKESAENLEERRNKLRRDISLVPQSDRLDRLLRYEAHLRREREHTFSQLERLQRMRLGQPVPPPIKVQLSS